MDYWKNFDPIQDGPFQGLLMDGKRNSAGGGGGGRGGGLTKETKYKMGDKYPPDLIVLLFFINSCTTERW